MAKKKKTTTTVEEEEEPQELDYQKDIQNKSMLEVALDTPDEKKEEKTPEEEKPAEKEEEKLAEPAFDPEAFKKEVAEQTKKDLLETLQGTTKAETEENVDEYQKYQEKFFKANNRQPTWFEVAGFMETEAVKKLEAKQEAQAKAREEDTAKQRADLEAANESTNKYIKDTLDELYTNEKLPQIQDPKNKDDYGIRVQHALMQKIVEVNNERIANKLPAKTLKEVFYEDFAMPRRDVPGGKAPTNMGRGGSGGEDESEEMDYVRDLQGKSVRQILTQAFKRK